MAIFIKNDRGTNGSWAGLSIDDQTYVLLDSAAQLKFTKDDTALADIGAKDLIVSLSGDATGHLTVAEGMKHLLGTLPTHIANPFPDNEGNYSFRGAGDCAAIINGTTDVDILISETRLINGAEVWTDTDTYGSYVTFQIVDVDNVLGYGAGLVVEEFGDKWQLHPKTPTKAFPGYVASIPALLYVRLKVVSTVAGNVHFNLHLHKT